MSIKDEVLQAVQSSGALGLTAPEFLHSMAGTYCQQSVYPCFTQLYKAGLILDSTLRRKSARNRRSIVWVSSQYGGSIPVWGTGHPSYKYGHRAKFVMDLILDFGPLSVSEIVTATRPGKTLEAMSTSSLVSQLVNQGWLHKTNQRRPNMRGHLCYLYDLTPRGRQVQESSPSKDRRDVETAPTILEVSDA